MRRHLAPTGLKRTPLPARTPASPWTSTRSGPRNSNGWASLLPALLTDGRHSVSPSVAYQDGQPFADLREDFGELVVRAPCYTTGAVDLTHESNVERIAAPEPTGGDHANDLAEALRLGAHPASPSEKMLDANRVGDEPSRGAGSPVLLETRACLRDRTSKTRSVAK
jgi:hypothetical protein